MGPPVLSVLLLALLASATLRQSGGSFITVQSFKCTHNKELCSSITCSSDVARHRVPVINCGCMIPRPLHNVTVDLKLQSVKGARFETLVNGKENMCDIANRSVRGELITRVFESITKYFKGFKCPFQGNVTAVNLPISLSFAPGLMPASSYRVLAEVKNGQDLVMGAELRFLIMKYKPMKSK